MTEKEFINMIAEAMEGGLPAPAAPAVPAPVPAAPAPAVPTPESDIKTPPPTEEEPEQINRRQKAMLAVYLKLSGQDPTPKHQTAENYNKVGRSEGIMAWITRDPKRVALAARYLIPHARPDQFYSILDNVVNSISR